jgi:hypothetical protein
MPSRPNRRQRAAALRKALQNHQQSQNQSQDQPQQSHQESPQPQEPAAFPARPMTEQEIENHASRVRQHLRADVVQPSPVPETAAGKLRVIDAYTAERIDGGDMIDFTMLVCEYHSVWYSIEDLEATDAVEQMIEELSDEQMVWIDALENVAGRRRLWYNRHFPTPPSPANSRATMLRRNPNFPLHSRVLEYIELKSFLSGFRLLSNEEMDSGKPALNTNRSYWGIRNTTDYARVVERELAYFASVPGIIGSINEMLPWLRERGWTQAAATLMAEILILRPGTRREMQMTEKAHRVERSDGDLYKPWSESRKPGVVLRDRPRFMHPQRLIIPNNCPQCIAECAGCHHH